MQEVEVTGDKNKGNPEFQTPRDLTVTVDGAWKKQYIYFIDILILCFLMNWP